VFISLTSFFDHIGTKIEINETGTTLRFKPGLLMGGPITHDCGTSRSMGWFIEGILPLAPFCKFPLNLTLSGITNDDLDLSVDILTQVSTFPVNAFSFFVLF
jgi:RNA 3'-terminal phosphate cyclase-like protein